MSVINITLDPRVEVKDHVRKSLNRFHFKTIRLVSAHSANLLSVDASGGACFRACDSGLSLKLSCDYLKVIQDAMDSYLLGGALQVDNGRVKDGRHLRPFVDEFADRMEKEILSFLGKEREDTSAFGVLLTHDVDGVGKFYLGSVKSSIVFLLNSLRSVKEPALSYGLLKRGLRFLFGNVDYGGFGLILSSVRRHGISPVVMFYSRLKGGNGLSTLERLMGLNPSYRLSDVRQDITSLREAKVEIGLHGSYKSASEIELIEAEVQELERETGVKCRSVRQHYLKSCGSLTHYGYHAAGLTYDLTCGYIRDNAFLCGTCRPFFSSQDGVIVLPMIYMDAVHLYFKPVLVDSAKKEIDELLGFLKVHSGFASFNFHQRMMSAISEVSEIYEYIIEKTEAMGGRIVATSEIEELYPRFSDEN